MDRWVMIAITTIVAVLILLVEHWGPWQRLTQKKFHPIANYIQGLAAILLPLSVLLSLWGEWIVVGALWCVVVASGLAVIGAYWLDGWIETRNELRAKSEESGILREMIDDDPGETTTRVRVGKRGF